MSTRAVYTFKATGSCQPDFHVYKHHGGYPSGAAIAISKALPFAWALPRYENDEFSASFVAANKDMGGGVRLTNGPQAHGDLAFRYEIYMSCGHLRVTSYESDGWSEWAKCFDGTLDGFTDWANNPPDEEVSPRVVD